MLDIINIVFLEKGAQFDPSTIKSHFTHVFLVIKETDPDSDNIRGYSLAVVTHSEVPFFGPPLPEKAFFGNRYDLKDFLLAKCKFFSFIFYYILFICIYIYIN